MQERYTYLISLLAILMLPSCGVVVFDGKITKEKLISNSDFHWQNDTSEHFTYFFEKGSWSERNVESIKIDAEKSISRCLYLMNKTDYPTNINYFIVEDRNRMESLIYRETNGQAFPSQNIVCAIASESTKALGSHEIFHIISHNINGPTQNWISEGMAVYSDNAWRRQELHMLSNYLRLNGKLIPLKELMNNFRLYDDMLSYPQAGSLMKYLYEKYGADKIVVLWTQGIEAFVVNNGINLDLIEKEWISSISQYEIDKVHYVYPN